MHLLQRYTIFAASYQNREEFRINRDYLDHYQPGIHFDDDSKKTEPERPPPRNGHGYLTFLGI